MDWINRIFSLLSNSKSKIIIGIVCVFAVIGIVYGLYQHGYNVGVAEITTQVDKERKQWSDKVVQLQTDYDKQTITLTEQHKNEIEKLNKQLIVLKNNPKIVEKYIPIQMDVNIPETMVLLHNRAVNGTPLDQMIPDELVDQTSSCTLSDLSSKVAYNYSVCNQCYDKLTKLQTIVSQYIEKQKELKKNEK